MAKAHEIGKNLICFTCPGCEYDHGVGVNGRMIPGADGSMNTWQWNQSLDSPTFMPSLLIFKNDASRRCHSFVTDGKIRFLDDCFHPLKGKTVELEEWGA